MSLLNFLKVGMMNSRWVSGVRFSRMRESFSSPEYSTKNFW